MAALSRHLHLKTMNFASHDNLHVEFMPVIVKTFE
jgi:hypothetical protein